jgi:hypothetical protein
MQTVAEMTERKLELRQPWLAAYALMAVLTLIFQIYVRTPQCTPDCALSYAKAVVWSSIWPASWTVFLAGIA